MKKFLYVIVIFMLIPFINVMALECYGSNKDSAIILSGEDVTNNFSCTGIEGDNLTFTNNGEDVSKYFQLRSDKSAIDIVDKTLVFPQELEYGLIVVTDSGNEQNTAVIYIKNSAYVKPTTTTSTTTTKDPTIKTYTVTLDPNNGGEISKKTCDVNSANTTCNITLPKIEKATFNGWGTAKTCKEGNSGTIKVDKDVTYYACYTDNSNTMQNEDNSNNTNEEDKLFLKTLSLVDKITNETIEFGTFSIKKNEYNFKVLNNIENIIVNATSDEGVNIEVSGNENLVVGLNTISIKLTNSRGATNEYILKVTRLEEGETINNIKYLKSLIVGGYTIDFNKETLVYNLTIEKNIKKLEITAIPEDDTDTVEIRNNENLEDGSQIQINLVGEDNNSTSYMININKDSSTNYLLFVGIGLIVVLIILLIVLIIIKSNKNKKGHNNKQQNNQIEVLNI